MKELRFIFLENSPLPQGEEGEGMFPYFYVHLELAYVRQASQIWGEWGGAECAVAAEGEERPPITLRA